MLFHTSSCIKFADISLSKASPRAEPRDRVGGICKIRVKRASTGRPLIRATNIINLLQMGGRRSWMNKSEIGICSVDGSRWSLQGLVTLYNSSWKSKQDIKREQLHGEETCHSLCSMAMQEYFSMSFQQQEAEGTSTQRTEPVASWGRKSPGSDCSLFPPRSNCVHFSDNISLWEQPWGFGANPLYWVHWHWSCWIILQLGN